MALLKEVLMSMRARKGLYIIVYIQLTITFFTTIYAASKIGEIADYTASTKNFINEKWLKPSVSTPAAGQSLSEKGELIKEWYDYMSSLEEVESVGAINNGTTIDYDDVKPKYDKDIPKHLITICSIDKMFLDYYVSNVAEGRGLNAGDYNRNDLIPVVISSDLRDKYSIDTVIEKRYKVVGVLNSRAAIPGTSDLYNFTTRKEKFIIAPIQDIDFAQKNDEMISFEYYVRYFQDIYIELKDMSKFSVFKDKVDQKANELGLPIRITLPAAIIEKRTKDGLMFYLPELCVALITLILSILGNIAVYLSLVLRRKREFGIKLAMGASVERLCKALIIEVALLIALGFITSAAIFYIIHMVINFGSQSYNTILGSVGGTTAAIILLTAIIILICVSLPIIIKIKKFQPSELIKDV